MSSVGAFNRRSFVVGAAAVSGGLALGFAIPFAKPARAEAGVSNSDINCWVAIAPDDAVTIRVAHDEMGQGAMTGLAMLVVEELDCDWNKVRTQTVSPQENVRRNRIWGDTSTGASRSIATSHLY